MATQPRPSLRDACVVALSKQLHATPRAMFAAVAWNEDVLLELLAVRARVLHAAAPPWLTAATRQVTLQLGRLNEHTLSLFQAVAPENPRLAAQLRALNIQPLPVLAPSSGRAWLGQKPHLY